MCVLIETVELYRFNKDAELLDDLNVCIPLLWRSASHGTDLMHHLVRITGKLLTLKDLAISLKILLSTGPLEPTKRSVIG